MRIVAALWLASLTIASPPQVADDLARAEKLLGQKDYAAAEILLKAIVRSDPKNARAHGNLSLALLPQRKVREAVEEGRLAATYAPESAQARFIYGLALRAAGRPADAAREFAKASALEPSEVGPLEALAGAYAVAGDERASAAYERLLELDPGRSRHALEFAAYLWGAGKAERGNAIAGAAVERFPDDGALRAAYGFALLDQQRFADAAQQLARARDLGLRDAETLGALGSALSQAGRTAEADAAFEAAVRQHPDAVALRLELGRLRLSQGEGDAALRELEPAAGLAPADAAVRFQLGRAYEAVGRLDDAEAAYRKAMELSPNLASPRYALGRLLVRRGRRDEGEKELETYRALYARAAKAQFETESRRSEILLADSELARGEPKAALARLESLPEGAEVLKSRAKALSRLDRHAEAVSVLERARELKPDDPRIQTLLSVERARVSEKP